MSDVTPDPIPVVTPDLIEVERLTLENGDPALKVKPRFHAGQHKAWNSAKRIVLVLAGWQSGKSVIGPLWLFREIHSRGPGDYIVACPTYPLMTKKVLPEFIRLFDTQCGLGKFVGGKNVFTFSEHGAKVMFNGVAPETPTKVFFGHAGDPDSLESTTAKAAWLDEAGQSGFRLESWEAIMGRLSIHTGRVLITTRPYNLGWIKTQLHDPWQAAGRNHPYIDVVNFRSIDNPAFPKAEYDRAKTTMPAWRVGMKYDGLLTRPAGVIYEAFDTQRHVVKRRPLPPEWPRHVGVDFGAVNTAAVFLAAELTSDRRPTGRHFVYRTYHPAREQKVKVSPARHVEAILQLAGGPIEAAVGGAGSEDEARNDFSRAGLYVHEPPVRDVEVGIDRAHALIQQGNLLVFDDCTDLIDELSTYGRELNEQGQPTEKIENKSDFHLADSLRYVCTRLYGGSGGSVKTGQDGVAAGDWTTPTSRPGRRDDPAEERDRGGVVGVGRPGAVWPGSW